MADFNYIHIQRSARRTLSVKVTPEGIFLRAPQHATKKQIEAFVQEHADWIRKRAAQVQERAAAAAGAGALTETEKKELRRRAAQVIPGRVALYAQQLGVTYGQIRIRFMTSRWGSCGPNGDLTFNALLMLAPPEVADSVIVHELCHRLEMNHSRRFYEHVLRVMPDYHDRQKWLKQEGMIAIERYKHANGKDGADHEAGQ